MPFFEVKVIAQVVVFIEAPNEDAAQLACFEDANFLHSNHKEVQGVKELAAPEDIERSKRHSDQILSA